LHKNSCIEIHQDLGVLPSLSIITVAWKCPQLIRAYMAALQKARQSVYLLKEIVIVDNEAQDDLFQSICHLLQEAKQEGITSEIEVSPGVKAIEKVYTWKRGLGRDETLKIISSPKNLGFAAACNLGFQRTQSEFTLFLNPDLELGEFTLDGAISSFQRHFPTGNGILGIKLLEGPDRVQVTCARKPKPFHFINEILGLDRILPSFFPSHHIKNWEYGTSSYVHHVIGAFYLLPSKTFEALNGFDARFFVYLEDLDLSTRANNLGCRVFFDKNLEALHPGGGTSSKARGHRVFYAARSRILYSFKHFSVFSGLVIFAATMTVGIALRFCLAAFAHSSERWQEAKGFSYLILTNALPILKAGMEMRQHYIPFHRICRSVTPQ
jgi:GT2 family glycosyltransferase